MDTGFGFGLINNKGQLVEGSQGNRISYQNGMYFVEEKGKFGIKNIDDEWVMQPVYDYIERFRDGYARVVMHETTECRTFFRRLSTF